MIRNPRIVRGIAVYLLFQFASSIVVPSASYALTSGPSQPEFSSFEPVATTNMVDEFSGDFTYNLPLLEVPGPNGSGYPVSLSYHSGASPEEEASWVGYGWTLNAGAINRSLRGLPDDYNGQNITFHNKMPKNWTGTVGLGVAFEVFGKDLGLADLSLNVALRYNNYRGFGYNTGVGLSLGKGVVSLGYGESDGEKRVSASVNPYAALNWVHGAGATAVNGDRMVRILKKGGHQRKNNHAYSPGVGMFGSTYGMFSYTESTLPNVVGKYNGKSYNVTIGIEGNPIPLPVGGTTNITGSYAYQQNVPMQDVPAYGFMYSAEGAGNTAALMDYHVEQESDFNKREVFLGVPFNDADNFIVTGEGIGGGFRLHNKTAGHFGPRHVESQTELYNVGGEIGAGWTFGPGADVGKGKHTLTARDWTPDRDLSVFQSASNKQVDEPVFFRFSSDLAGEWGTNHTDKPIRVKLDDHDISLDPNYARYNQSDERVGRSSYIGYHLNGEMQYADGRPKREAYCRDNRVNAILQRNAEEYRGLVGEMSVTNTAGNRYVYGLPVYAKGERKLSYSAASGVGHIEADYLADVSSRPNDDIKVGEEKLSPYATTYLLTEITTPDYVDRGTADNGYWGSSPDDLGGYTYFSYLKSGSEWYTWRAPYAGMLYQKNSHSDPLDDMVSYAEGQKELYYLKYIETKTHVAIFETSERKDGYGASANAFSTNRNPGPGRTEKLDRIDLYLLADCKRNVADGKITGPKSGRKPIKSVLFDYTNDLATGIPNGLTETTGKLTLTHVHFEYNGTNPTKISPYEFEYAYPKDNTYGLYPDHYKNGADNVVSFYANMKGSENPVYDPLMTDAWGNYQFNGRERFANDRPWLNQKAVDTFDPAAWQLKVIRLPSGGEIHVQYEQDDYSYVQNQEAHVMVALKYDPNEQNSPTSQLFHRYYIDPKSIGIDDSDAMALKNMRDMIGKRYVEGKKKIYFRFLYSLIGNDVPNMTTCNAEKVSGYASVVSCGANEIGTYIELLKEDNNRLPREACIDFVKSQRLGKVVPSNDCSPSGMDDPSDPGDLVNQLSNMVLSLALPGDDNLCVHLNEQYSYFRIPTPLAKKGGGVRVKRLLMFDKGLENDAVLYGNEYIYQMKGEAGMISSGVATNEPLSMREENILVDFVARKVQKFGSKLVAGEDKEQSEGPIGETILPAPSVGYARVVVKNIYSGNTAPGYSISQFNTAREYPIRQANPDDGETMTPIAASVDNPKPQAFPFYTKIRTKTSAVQGFSFVVNSMHGQPQSVLNYQGTYSPSQDLSGITPVSGFVNTYFSPGANIPVMSSRYSGITGKKLGREVDLTFAQRQVVEDSDDVNAEVDLQITIIPLAFIVLVIPYPTAIPTFSDIRGELNTHATTKVVHYPAILKKRTLFQNGIKHTEENLAFDEHTGQAVAVRASDEFQGAYLTQTIPASWEYSAMAGKWKTEGKRVTGTFLFTDDYLTLGDDPCNLAFFTDGDQVRLGDASSESYYYVTGKDYLGNRLQLALAQGATAATASVSEIEIIRAGRTNQLTAQAGTIQSHYERAENAALNPVDQANRYSDESDKILAGAQSFAQDLRDAAKVLSGKGDFTLPGPYTEMDMSAFAAQAGTCSKDLSNITIREVTFRYEVGDDSQAKIELMEFWMDCSGIRDGHVKAEGWKE
ncbi:hypothetical protein KK062_20055 [Fulvivirgaceae bacterium PWU5]|uniref:Uncharacterized protein n=1 Tax=Dawidia cretensis TaxID=2782350 RepID=A0AAP2GRN8_9BACT|nr:hypothetical protein [Dawidia cretensis]MBT1710549.1 hypothetical protein [Dawidia cretensis]